MLPTLVALLAGFAAQAVDLAVPAQRAKALPGRYMRDLDYPPSALRKGEQGTVKFQLVIGTNGRVSACNILQSSGSAALDAATCSMLTARARFEPARDANGNAVTDSIDNEIGWRLP